MQRCPVILTLAVFFLLPALSFAGTGILEIQSQPSGARVSIDGVDVGATPYQNVDMPLGNHRVTAVLGPEYPPQVQDVLIDEQSPKVLVFKFLAQNKGKFTGQEIVSTASRYRGNFTLASIPTSARIAINGEPLKQPAPVGFTDVEVGRYRVEFTLEGRTLRTDFDVIQGETIKLVADFTAGKVINKWAPGAMRSEPGKPEGENREEKAAQKQPTLPSESAEKIPPAAPIKPLAKAGETTMEQPVSAPEPLVEAPSPSAVQVRPEAMKDIPPYGELEITVNVNRDAGLKYTDYFGISSPKLALDSLSGPLFPKEAIIGKPASKDNFEYLNNIESDTRQFSARINFSSREAQQAEARAKSSVITVREGNYNLKLTRRRMADNFYSVRKVFEETALEAIEIVRGSRLIVLISSHIDAENKLRYEIKRSYAATEKKSNEKKKASAKEQVSVQMPE